MNKGHKIAILTNYYQINNYGAVLQAYALNRVIRSFGYECETLSFSNKNTRDIKQKIVRRIEVGGLLSNIKYLFILPQRFFAIKRTNEVRLQQKVKMERFNDFRIRQIPHSDILYTNENISNSLMDYDAFVCGSDQIWNLDGNNFGSGFFMEFVDETKTKVSYAAGMCTSSFSPEQENYLSKVLEDFDAISVREDNIQKLLQPIVDKYNKNVYWAVDPSLLLTPEQWDEVAAPYQIEEAYIFVYMLIPDKERYKIIKNFSAQVGLKIATLSHIQGRYEPLDKNFGDINLNDCGPEEFISLIKHARYVFTDSFHGFAFSTLYGKEFFAFLRKGNEFSQERNNRICSLAKRLGLNDRIINENMNPEQILKIKPRNNEAESALLNKVRKESYEWLCNALNSGKNPVIRPILYVHNSSLCSGCGACAMACPEQCISMDFDGEGFLRPVIDSEKCMECRICEVSCPVLNKVEVNTETLAFAAYNTDNYIRVHSTSGGIFSLLAKKIIKQGGVVYGAAFENDFSVAHRRIESEEQLPSLYGSKYVQSRLGNCMKMVKIDLEDGIKVLFSGTPCQIAGLKAFLGKDYPNLITQDLICHGVPSPKVWKKYLAFRRSKAKSDIKEICFRSKINGYRNPQFQIRFANGVVSQENVGDNLYYRGFLLNLFLRPSCYSCVFKSSTRNSDITLADFWGGEHISPDMITDDKGVSLVLVHSSKGRDMWEELSEDVVGRKVDVDTALKHNGMALKSARLHPLRKAFFETYDNLELEEFYKIYLRKILFFTKIKKSIAFRWLYPIYTVHVKGRLKS